MRALPLVIIFLPSPGLFMWSERGNEQPWCPFARHVFLVQNPTPASFSGHLLLKSDPCAVSLPDETVSIFTWLPNWASYLLEEKKKKSELPPAWQKLKWEAIQMWFLKEQLICFTHHLPSLKIKKLTDKVAIGQDLRRAKIQKKKLISNCETQPARANSPIPNTQHSPSGKCSKAWYVCLLIFFFF